MVRLPAWAPQALNGDLADGRGNLADHAAGLAEGDHGRVSRETLDVEKLTTAAPSSEGIDQGVGVKDVATTPTGGLQ